MKVTKYDLSPKTLSDDIEYLSKPCDSVYVLSIFLPSYPVSFRTATMSIVIMKILNLA